MRIKMGYTGILLWHVSLAMGMIVLVFGLASALSYGGHKAWLTVFQPSIMQATDKVAFIAMSKEDKQQYYASWYAENPEAASHAMLADGYSDAQVLTVTDMAERYRAVAEQQQATNQLSNELRWGN